MFALDSSGTVGSVNFLNLLNFVVDVVDQYNIGASATRVGIVRYSSTAEISVSLNQFNSKVALVNAILNIAFIGGSTGTDVAIEQVRQEFAANGRSTANKVLIVATDGQSSNPSSTTSQAQLAMNEGIEILSIGIGSGVNEDELNKIASDPDSSHVLTITDYSAESFASIIQELTQGICKGITHNKAIIGILFFHI